MKFLCFAYEEERVLNALTREMVRFWNEQGEAASQKASSE